MVMEAASGRDGHGGKPLCGAAKRQGGGCCRKPAGWGTTHVGRGRCRLHGGSTRTQTRKATDQEVEARARTALAQLGARPVDNPLAELQRLAGRVLAWERVIGEMVNELGSIRYETEFGGEQLRSEVALLERAMDRCERVLVAMAKLNIDERLAQIKVRLSRTQADVLTGIVLGAFADIGLSAELVAAVKPAMARRLREVAPLDEQEAAELYPPSIVGEIEPPA